MMDGFTLSRSSAAGDLAKAYRTFRCFRATQRVMVTPLVARYHFVGYFRLSGESKEFLFTN